MARCTVEQVYDHARYLLNDVRRSGGEFFTNDRLQTAAQRAFSRLIEELVDRQAPAIERTGYLVVPAYTSAVFPNQVGFPDMGEIVSIRERPAVSTRAVTGATSTSPIVLTCSTTGLTPAVPYIVSGVLGQWGANGRWFLTIGSGEVTLKGSQSVGAYTSGGTISEDTGTWSDPLDEWGQLPDRLPESTLREYEYSGGALRFVGCSADVQLEIVYHSSGSLPESGDIGVEDSLNYMAAETASIAAKARPDFAVKAAGLAAEAQGHMDTLISNLVRDMQRVPWQRKMFGRGNTKAYRQWRVE